jgi:hypothetical protein
VIQSGMCWGLLDEYGRVGIKTHLGPLGLIRTTMSTILICTLCRIEAASKPSAPWEIAASLIKDDANLLHASWWIAGRDWHRTATWDRIGGEF